MAKGRSMVVIDEAFCKGCGLCTGVCPTNILELNQNVITPKGYHPAICIDESACIGCGSCALICPDVAITVLKEAV